MTATHRLCIVSLLVLMFTASVRAQVNSGEAKSGTINVDGTPYCYTLTPLAVPPASPIPTSLPFKMLPFSPFAPATVHVNALDLPLATGSPTTATYEWDFGDGSPTAKLRGWTAAHVYDAPGEYNLTLRITDESGAVTRHQTSVTIQGDNRRTFYVSADGDDANPGTLERPIRSFARAATVVGDNTRILFRRGDRFDVPDMTAMSVRSRNVLIGAYGEDAKPLPVLWKLPNTKERVVITMFKPVRDVVVQELCFDGPYSPAVDGRADKIPHDPIHPAGDNITVRRCLFLNVNDAANTQRKVTGFLFEGNRAPLDSGVRSYLVWGQGSDHVYLNNTFANSTREHGFRMNGLTRVLIAGNTMANLDRTPMDKEDIAKGCIEVHSASYAYIVDNHVTKGALRVGPRGGDSELPDTAMNCGVIEGNTLDDVSIQVRPGAHDVMIRNNVVRHAEGIRVYQRDSAGRTSRDIVVDRNTVIARGEQAQFLVVEGPAERITLTNNLLVAPSMYVGKNAAAAVYVGNPDLSCFKRIAGNVWPVPTQAAPIAKGGGLFYVATKWGDPAGYLSLDKWRTFPQVQDDVTAAVNVDAEGRPDTSVLTKAVGASQTR